MLSFHTGGSKIPGTNGRRAQASGVDGKYKQACNQLGTSGGAKSIPRGAQIF